MHVPTEVWTQVRNVEAQINSAGLRAQAALTVALTQDDGTDDLVTIGVFLQQVDEILAPLHRLYDWINTDNRVDIADVMHLGRFLGGLAEVTELWVDKLDSQIR
jgi:hypothetical protein